MTPDANADRVSALTVERTENLDDDDDRGLLTRPFVADH
jgi:hypothetical protein